MKRRDFIKSIGITATAWPFAVPRRLAAAQTHAHLSTKPSWSTVQADEHAAVLNLVPIADATHIAVRSGMWSAPETWRDLNIPVSGARIWIPDGLHIQLGSDLLDTTFAWIRVDGSLSLMGDKETGLKVITLIIGETAFLEIGTADERVQPGKSATIVFADRGPRDRIRDPLDLSGGLISLGRLRAHGAFVLGHVGAAENILPNQNTIKVHESPEGWKVGDLVIIPGTNPRADEDEMIRIADVDVWAQRITLEKAPRFTHSAPEGAQIRIGNLTRNVIFRSENESSLDRRGHFMIMHVQSGVLIDGAAFYGLGRTDTKVAHTTPTLDQTGALIEGTDANTIGRYAVHFHIRSGARFEHAPHLVQRCVVMNAPKHGVVNHGGHVIADGNVTFRVDGTHFFAENGREIGEFRNNVAIRSMGSDLSQIADGLMSRMYVYDFGHGGYGYWLQGGGVRLVHNYAFGQRAAGYSINGNLMREGGEFVFFATDNIEDRSIRDTDFHPGDVPFYFSDNQAAGCFNGMDIWYTQIGQIPEKQHAVPGLVTNSFFWALERHGIFMPYSRNIIFRDVTVLGGGTDSTSFGFGGANEFADSLIFERVRAEGFGFGVDLPTKGITRVEYGYLDNVVNIRVRSGPGEDLDAEIVEVRFGARQGVDVLMAGFPELTPAVVANIGGSDIVPPNADLSVFLGRKRVILKHRDTGGARKQIYFAEQAPSAIPFTRSGVAALAGKTSREIWEKFGVAFGGAVAPTDAVPQERIIGLIGSTVGYGPRARLVSDRFTGNLSHYVLRLKDDHDRIWQAGEIDLVPGWNVVRVAQTSSDLVYGDTASPKFEVDAGFPSEIHPADLPFGITVRGAVVYSVGVVNGRYLVVQHFTGLIADPDGFVRFELPILSPSGNRKVIPFAIRVTEQAVVRSHNTLFYSQGSSERKFLRTGKPAPYSTGKQVLTLAAVGGLGALAFLVERWVRRRDPEHQTIAENAAVSAGELETRL